MQISLEHQFGKTRPIRKIYLDRQHDHVYPNGYLVKSEFATPEPKYKKTIREVFSKLRSYSLTLFLTGPKIRKRTRIIIQFTFKNGSRLTTRTQWGDEGKGENVDVLQKYDHYRHVFQGRTQCWPTLEFDGIKHVFCTLIPLWNFSKTAGQHCPETVLGNKNPRLSFKKELDKRLRIQF